jgi:hypothetical protein
VASIFGENAGNKICKSLPAPGGLTSMNRIEGRTNEFHLFYNMRPATNGPIKIFRETVSVEPFQFVSGNTKTFFNTNNFLNFDINNQLSTTQRIPNRVDTRALNNAGNFTGPFRRLPPFFGSPFSTSVINPQGGPVITSTLFFTGQDSGITFRNLQNNFSRSFAFTGPSRPLSHDTAPLNNDRFLVLTRDVRAGNPDRVSTFLRAINRDDFFPAGNVIQVDPPRPDPNPNSFNTSCVAQVRLVTPTGTNEFHGTAFTRYRGNTYDWYFRRFDSGTLRPLGGARRVVTNPPNTTTYGCSLLNFDPDPNIPRQ